MAMRKMTFTIPDDLASSFARAVPSAKRSRFVAEALRVTLRQREQSLAAACDAVNADAQLNSLTDEWQAIIDPIEEPWNDSTAG
jgi:hypothetical protein